MTRWIPWAFAAVGLTVMGCSTATLPDDEGGSGPAGTGGAGGGGGSGDSGGGSTVSSGGGEGGVQEPRPCVIDCSTIQLPQCFLATCDASSGQCVVAPASSAEPCDDGLFCTVGDSCAEGVCQGGAENDCGLVPDDCHVSVCDESIANCSFQNKDDGVACETTDLCTVNGICSSGLCVGSPKSCFFFPLPDSCHIAQCNPATGECEASVGNEGVACSDSGDLCKTGKTCQGGLCDGGTAKNCSALSVGCKNGVCDPGTGTCYAEPVPPDGNCAQATNQCNAGLCTDSGTCIPVPTPGVACASATNECNTGLCTDGGTCIAVPTPGVACASATNQCNLGFCSVTGLCVPQLLSDGTTCSDGKVCTEGETCLAGVCQGGQNIYVEYLKETFANNVAGWTLGTEWQIGSATASVGGATGNQDPASDHTATADNGIAGVVIGGYPAKAIHEYYYLTSPIIDTNGPGSVIMEYWRFLNSDSSPFMNNLIEVWDGSSWQHVWQSGPPPTIHDAAWTKVSYDLTAHKNASMQVRFGFNIGSTNGLYTVSGWNIDDIVIANMICN